MPGQADYLKLTLHGHPQAVTYIKLEQYKGFASVEEKALAIAKEKFASKQGVA